MLITFPTNTTEVIDAIRSAIGREVTFYAEYSVPCSACTLDPVTNTSTNSFCLVCSGEGYVITYSGTTLTGHVTHYPSEIMQWSTGGQYIEGDCRVQIKYTPANITVVDTASYAIIDGKKFDVRKKIMRGFRELNRILIDLIQRQ